MSSARTQTFTLGKHWNEFIERKLSEGKYSTASEIVRDSLRLLEEKEENQKKLEALRQAIIDGENSGNAGRFNPEKIKNNAMKRAGLVD